MSHGNLYVIQLFNEYRSIVNGEQTVVQQTHGLLERHGFRTRLVTRSSRDIAPNLWGKAQAFVSGIYSRAAYRDMRQLLDEERPDLVHSHNVYPLFSPAALVACRDAGVPVVLSLHNHMLTCPKSDHLYQGTICERCVGGKEIHCVLRNCRSNIFESLGYAARSAAARHFRWFHDSVTTYIALTHFARERLIQAGFAAERISVLNNAVELPATAAPDPAAGKYVAFVGRLSAEKGVELLVEAARQLPDVSFRIAGDGPLAQAARAGAPANVTFLGPVPREDLSSFYSHARFVVAPSQCFEMCPLVVLEAMAHGLPVVASRLGGVPELVSHGETGLLCRPGDASELATSIRQLWSDPDFIRRAGQAGRQRAEQHHTEDAYWERLATIYHHAVNARHSSPPATTMVSS